MNLNVNGKIDVYHHIVPLESDAIDRITALEALVAGLTTDESSLKAEVVALEALVQKGVETPAQKARLQAIKSKLDKFPSKG